MISTGQVAAAPTRAAGTTRHHRRPHITAERIGFLVVLLSYLAVTLYVAFAANTMAVGGGDGVSRVEIASRVFFSRDPHLGAIGFVWGPMPVLLLLPLVALKTLWPALVTDAVAGHLVSAVFMAGAVAQLFRLLGAMQVDRRLRWALTAVFALDPMIVLFAANTMSEAVFLFFLLGTAYHLTVWLRARELRPLVATGFYLALAYLTRYEAGAAAIAVAAIVGVATFLVSVGGLRERLGRGALDAVIVGAPFAAAFIGFAVISWLLVGTPFQQFSSSYSNEAEVQLKTAGHAETLAAATLQAIHGVLSIEPFLPVAFAACLAVALRRRAWSALGGSAVLGMVVAFMFSSYVTGEVPRLLRYFIVAIPLTIVMCGVVLASPPPRELLSTVGHDGSVMRIARPGSGYIRKDATPPRRTLRGLVVACVIAAMALTVPWTARALLDPAVNSDAYGVQALLKGGAGLTPDQQGAWLDGVSDVTVSRYIDSLHLGRGAVLVDDFDGFIIVMSSPHPEQYIITSDRDFIRALAEPAASGVEYVLVPSEQGNLAKLDAVNRQYPAAYSTGAGIGTLVKQFNDYSQRHVNWRLYRVGPSR